MDTHGDDVAPWRESPCVKALRLCKCNALDLGDLENIAEKAATPVGRPQGVGLTRSDGDRCYAAIGVLSFLVERDLVTGLNKAALKVRVRGVGPEGTQRAAVLLRNAAFGARNAA